MRFYDFTCRVYRGINEITSLKYTTPTRHSTCEGVKLPASNIDVNKDKMLQKPDISFVGWGEMCFLMEEIQIFTT